MPELPEVETIVRGLNKSVLNRRIKSVEIRVKKLFNGESKDLIGISFKKVSRIGKNIIIELSSGDILAIHLKMTGQLIFLTKNQVKSQKSKVKSDKKKIIFGGHPDKAYDQFLPHKHTHIIINFADGSVLYYNDLRKFGYFKIINNKEKIKNTNKKLKKIISQKLGLDALDKKLTTDYLINICKGRKTTIKQLLLDQSVIAGIGNIYGDEILFCAKINPKTKILELTRKDFIGIAKCIPQILKTAIKAGGTSHSDYRKLDGSQGGYMDIAMVYRREGLPCRICKTPIKRIKIGQRSSHFCPNCQK